jgi:predicted ester cyclase
VEILDMIAEGEQVVLEWTHRGTHLGVYDGLTPSGKTVSGHAISVYHLVDGQTSEARGIWDRGEV